MKSQTQNHQSRYNQLTPLFCHIIMAYRGTHKALVLVAARAPYEIRDIPTVSPASGEILINVKWTVSTPLDLHQADGGLLVEYPMRTGSACAGVVVEVGPDVKHFKSRRQGFRLCL